VLVAGGVLTTALLLSSLAPGAAVAGARAGAGSGATPPAAGPSFVTILFGRAQFATAASCNPVKTAPDVKTLADAAKLFQAKGWKGTPNVVIDFANTGRCAGRKDYASWTQLSSLLSTPFGWQSISGSQSYPFNMASLTASQVQSESCATLPALTAKGFSRAWGLFAYPGGDYTYNKSGVAGSGNAQADIVHNCFAYGRIYGNGSNERARLVAPWLIQALSPVGGTAAGSAGTYQVPSVVAQKVATRVKPDSWFVIQYYRFRSGAVAGDHNCLGPESTHFTKFNEEYCWEDFQVVLAAIPAGAVVTDPATVACAWGRLPDAGPRPKCP
jgi:hypothetical protein